MEQENITSEENAAPIAEQPEVVNTPASEIVEQPKPVIRRKNGRNRTEGRNGSRNATKPQETCGEISDISTFKEKLSGSNVSGYGDSENAEEKKSQRFEKGERRRKNHEENAEENVVEENQNAEASEQSSEGPAFESSNVAPRAVEVSLSDRKPKFANDKDRKENGIVSYSSTTAECPSVSLLARIKNAIASIFGKKQKDNKKFRKDKRDFKNRKHGDKKFSNKGRRDDFKKRKGGHRYDRRPHNNKRHDRDGGQA